MRVYFLGICGTAMGHAALLMRDLGHTVAGSDQGIYPPMSTVLREAAIELLEGFDALRMCAWKPDLVVVGNAVSRGNPEVEWLLEHREIALTSLPALLHDHLLRFRHNIVVTGTHGKTTTATMTAHLLRAKGANPGWFIGGVPRDLPGGANTGRAGGAFVIEGDEYDSAFFDKRSKFLHYAPNILILNNLEFDHADIFRDLADIQRSFRHLLRIMPGSGLVLANGDDPAIAELLPAPWTQIETVGLGEHCTHRLVNLEETSTGIRAGLMSPEGDIELRLPLSGSFNLRNAAMAYLAARHASPAKVRDALPLACFQGVRRRQDILAEHPQLILMEDFAHHPTAVRETLQALRQRYPLHQLWTVFEPRSNTSCRALFQREFTAAFHTAHEVWLAPIHRPERYAQSGILDTAKMAADLQTRGIPAQASDTLPALEANLTQRLQAQLPPSNSPVLLLCLTNGSLGGMLPRLASIIADR